MLVFGGKRWNLKCEPSLYIRFQFQTPTNESPLSYVTPLALLSSTWTASFLPHPLPSLLSCPSSTSSLRQTWCVYLSASTLIRWNVSRVLMVTNPDNPYQPDNQPCSSIIPILYRPLQFSFSSGLQFSRKTCSTSSTSLAVGGSPSPQEVTEP